MRLIHIAVCDMVNGELARTDAKRNSDATPHALLLCYPVQSHIRPFMELAKHLTGQSVQVTFATMQHAHRKLVDNWERTPASFSDHHLFQLRSIPDGLPSHIDRQTLSHEQIQHIMDTSLQVGALELIQTMASEGCEVTCVVGDFHMPWTSWLAERAQVPEWVFWTQNASVFSIFLHADVISSSGIDLYTNNVMSNVAEQMITCVPGLPIDIPSSCLPFRCPQSSFATESLRKMMRQRLGFLRRAEGLICNSFDMLEQKVLLSLSSEAVGMDDDRLCVRSRPRSLLLVGPLAAIPASDEKKNFLEETKSSLRHEETQECKEWLDKQQNGSVLYAAFGSITVIQESQLKELVMGLAASGHRFLLALREDIVISVSSSLESRSQKPSSRPIALEQFLQKPDCHGVSSDICKVVRWSPQAQVLAHPAVGGFLSHCGWNSILESICAGIPVLGWPNFFDQFTNCWLVTDVWKMGIALRRHADGGETTRAEVADGVKQLMDGPLSASLRARARELKAVACAAAHKSHGISALVEAMRRNLKTK
ncbi:hypothetical protein KP509_11G060900 [Ceratopteris richardii]|uniref:Glycosyltransferase n=1 Tax=Ceratopteris richardii TaxID=49495 RepID=A0A8T2TW26_CERRI|nr:hypothetical protein KP509_11G060900 [Ceratopteris richardii]